MSNETVADIIGEIRAHWQGCENVSLRELDGSNLLNLADRIEAAHEREIAAMQLRSITIRTDNSAVIAELQRRLKVAERKSEGKQ